jgi:hypothetical protein
MLSREEILAVYAAGPEAVVELKVISIRARRASGRMLGAHRPMRVDHEPIRWPASAASAGRTVGVGQATASPDYS